mmetsp:Transcript_22196/g.31230  ORF Transcript_22196/g.31230 Transcript_22196/m.31230 type:complete len:200 (-) Transcript_22196:1433-2032(-)
MRGDPELYLMDTLRKDIPPKNGHPAFMSASSVFGVLGRERSGDANDVEEEEDERSESLFSIWSELKFAMASFNASPGNSNSSFPRCCLTPPPKSTPSPPNSVTRMTLIICDSKSVKTLTAQVNRPVMDRACVNPQPALPDFKRPILDKITDATAAVKTAIFPKVSNRTLNHRSKSLMVRKTDKFASCRDRWTLDQRCTP